MYPLSKGGEPKILKISKRGGGPEKKLGGTKRGGFKMKGGIQLLKLNLGIEKGKIGTFRDKVA